jgi:hypothetical protein
LLEGDILSQSDVNVRKAAAHILKEYGPKSEFTCQEYFDWGFQFASKILINIFFYNKQKLVSDSIRKDSIDGFKKRQRTN